MNYCIILSVKLLKKKNQMSKSKEPKKLTLTEKRSIAGSVGAASRWENHEKKPTKLVRMYTYDYDYLADLSRNNGVPVVLLVHRCIQHIRLNHGYSSLWSSDND